MTKTKRATSAASAPLFGPDAPARGSLTALPEAPRGPVFTFAVGPHVTNRVAGHRWVGTNALALRRDSVAAGALERPAFLHLPVTPGVIDSEVEAHVQRELTGIAMRWTRRAAAIPVVFYVRLPHPSEGRTDRTAEKLEGDGWTRVDLMLAPYAAAGARNAALVDSSLGPPPSALYTTSPSPRVFVNAPVSRDVTMVVAPFSITWHPYLCRASELVVGEQLDLASLVGFVGALTQAAAQPDASADAALLDGLRQLNLRGHRCEPIMQLALRTFPCSLKTALPLLDMLMRETARLKR